MVLDAQGYSDCPRDVTAWQWPRLGHCVHQKNFLLLLGVWEVEFFWGKKISLEAATS